MKPFVGIRNEFLPVSFPPPSADTSMHIYTYMLPAPSLDYTGSTKVSPHGRMLTFYRLKAKIIKKCGINNTQTD
jgi:hypothetical protein